MHCINSLTEMLPGILCLALHLLSCSLAHCSACSLLDGSKASDDGIELDKGSALLASRDKLRLFVCMKSTFAGNARETVRSSESCASDDIGPESLRGSTVCVLKYTATTHWSDKQLGDRIVPLRRLYSFSSERIGILSCFSGFRPFLASKSRSNLTILDLSSEIFARMADCAVLGWTATSVDRLQTSSSRLR